MMDVSRPGDDDGFRPLDEPGDGGTDRGMGTVRYLVGFVTSLLVYGLAPPVVTGGAIWVAHQHMGLDASISLLAVGAAVGIGIYTVALVADRGVSALTDPATDDEAPVSTQHRV